MQRHEILMRQKLIPKIDLQNGTTIFSVLQDKAQDALNFILSHLPKADRSSQSILLREATLLCSTYPVLCTDKMLAEVWQCSRNRYSYSVDEMLRTLITTKIIIKKVQNYGIKLLAKLRDLN